MALPATADVDVDGLRAALRLHLVDQLGQVRRSR